MSSVCSTYGSSPYFSIASHSCWVLFWFCVSARWCFLETCYCFVQLVRPNCPGFIVNPRHVGSIAFVCSTNHSPLSWSGLMALQMVPLLLGKLPQWMKGVLWTVISCVSFRTYKWPPSVATESVNVPTVHEKPNVRSASLQRKTTGVSCCKGINYYYLICCIIVTFSKHEVSLIKRVTQ